MSTDSAGIGFLMELTALDDVVATFSSSHTGCMFQMPAEEWRALDRPDHVDVEVKRSRLGGAL